MNKKEALLEMEQLKKRELELKSIIDAPEISKEEKAFQIWKDIWNSIDEIIFYPESHQNSIFYKSKGYAIFELDNGNNIFWCNYYKVWEIFEKELHTNYSETQALIKSLLGKHNKIVVPTPLLLEVKGSLNWGNIINSSTYTHETTKGTIRG